jgi:hypothetical protein
MGRICDLNFGYFLYQWVVEGGINLMDRTELLPEDQQGIVPLRQKKIVQAKLWWHYGMV